MIFPEAEYIENDDGNIIVIYPMPSGIDDMIECEAQSLEEAYARLMTELENRIRQLQACHEVQITRPPILAGRSFAVDVGEAETGPAEAPLPVEPEPPEA